MKPCQSKVKGRTESQDFFAKRKSCTWMSLFLLLLSILSSGMQYDKQPNFFLALTHVLIKSLWKLPAVQALSLTSLLYKKWTIISTWQSYEG